MTLQDTPINESDPLGIGKSIDPSDPLAINGKINTEDPLGLSPSSSAPGAAGASPAAPFPGSEFTAPPLTVMKWDTTPVGSEAYQQQEFQAQLATLSEEEKTRLRRYDPSVIGTDVVKGLSRGVIGLPKDILYVGDLASKPMMLVFKPFDWGIEQLTGHSFLKDIDEKKNSVYKFFDDLTSKVGDNTKFINPEHPEAETWSLPTLAGRVSAQIPSLVTAMLTGTWASSAVNGLTAARAAAVGEKVTAGTFALLGMRSVHDVMAQEALARGYTPEQADNIGHAGAIVTLPLNYWINTKLSLPAKAVGGQRISQTAVGGAVRGFITNAVQGGASQATSEAFKQTMDLIESSPFVKESEKEWTTLETAAKNSFDVALHGGVEGLPVGLALHYYTRPEPKSDHEIVQMLQQSVKEHYGIDAEAMTPREYYRALREDVGLGRQEARQLTDLMTTIMTVAGGHASLSSRQAWATYYARMTERAGYDRKYFAEYAQVHGESGFYSTMRDRIVEKLPAKGELSGEQILATLRNAGAKGEELEWTGTEAFLKAAQKAGAGVTRTQLLEFVDRNQIKLAFVQKDGSMPIQKDMQEAFRRYETLEKTYDDIKRKIDEEEDPQKLSQLQAEYAQIKDAMDASWKEYRGFVDSAADKKTQYDFVSPPGPRTKYQEWLVRWKQPRVPDSERINAEGEDVGDIEEVKFSHDHWEEPNVLLHVRTDERVGADGKPFLQVIEIQSDWHQQGRKYGYRDDNASGKQASEDVQPQEAPFQKTWPDLALKLILHRAIERGYDRIAIAPGWLQDQFQGASEPGRAKFYDEILPGKLLDLARKYDKSAKFTEAEVDYHDPQGLVEEGAPDYRKTSVKVFDISQALRDGVLGKGIALFQTGREAKLKQWFGNSKVVDADGKPLVMYHGTLKAGFTEFSPDKAGSSTDAGWLGKAFYFTDSTELANLYAGAEDNIDLPQYRSGIYPVYLKMENPLDLRKYRPFSPENEAYLVSLFGEQTGKYLNKHMGTDLTDRQATDISRMLQSKGYDGVLANIMQGDGSYKLEAAVFKPEQIKSINAKDFAPGPNILAQKATLESLFKKLEGADAKVRGFRYKDKDGNIRTVVGDYESHEQLRRVAGIPADSVVDTGMVAPVGKGYLYSGDTNRLEFIEGGKRVRLYRGEGEKSDAKLPDWAETNAGQWFTTDRKKAEQFAKARNGKIITIDLPENVAKQLRAPEGNALDEHLVPQELQDKYRVDESKKSVAEQLKPENTDVYKYSAKEARQAEMDVWLHDTKRGVFIDLANGRGLIRFLTNPDYETAVHEMAHFARVLLMNDADVAKLETVLKVEKDEQGRWSIPSEEKFAEWMVDSLKRGWSPDPQLSGVFERQADVLKALAPKIQSPINKELDHAIGRLFAREAEPVAAQRDKVEILEQELKDARNAVRRAEAIPVQEDTVKEAFRAQAEVRAKNDLKQKQAEFAKAKADLQHLIDSKIADIPQHAAEVKKRFEQWKDAYAIGGPDLLRYHAATITDQFRSWFESNIRRLGNTRGAKLLAPMLTEIHHLARDYEALMSQDLATVRQLYTADDIKFFQQKDEFGFTNWHRMIQDENTGPNGKLKLDAAQQERYGPLLDLARSMQEYAHEQAVALGGVRKLQSDETVFLKPSHESFFFRMLTPEGRELFLRGGEELQRYLQAVAKVNPGMDPESSKKHLDAMAIEALGMDIDPKQPKFRTRGALEFSRDIKNMPDVHTLKNGQRLDVFHNDPLEFLQSMVHKDAMRLATMRIMGQGVLKNYYMNESVLRETLRAFGFKVEYTKDQLVQKLAEELKQDPAELSSKNMKVLQQIAKENEVGTGPSADEMWGTLQGLAASDIPTEKFGERAEKLRGIAKKLGGIATNGDRKLSAGELTRMVSEIKARVSQDIEDNVFDHLLKMHEEDGGTKTDMVEVFRDFQGYPRGSMDRNWVTRGIRWLTTMDGARMTSLAGPKNWFQTPLSVPSTAGVRNFAKAVWTYMQDPVGAHERMLELRAFNDRLYTWTMGHGNGVWDTVSNTLSSKNIRQAVGKYTLLDLWNDMNRDVAALAGEFLAQEVKQKGLNAQREGLLRNMGINAIEMEQMRTGTMTEDTYRKIVQNTYTHSQHQDVPAHLQARMQLTPWAKLLLPFKNYSYGEARRFASLGGELKAAIKEEGVRSDRSKAAFGNLLVAVGSVVGSGMLMNMLMDKIKGRPEDDQETLVDKGMRALWEAEILSQVTWVTRPGQYATSGEKWLFSLAPHVQTLADLVSLVRSVYSPETTNETWAKLPFPEKLGAVLVDRTPAVKAAIHQTDLQMHPYLKEYQEVRRASSTWRQKNFPTPSEAGVQNPLYAGVWQAAIRGDRDEMVEARNDYLREQIQAGKDPAESLRNLRTSMLAHRPIPLADENMLRFLQTVPKEKRAAYIRTNLRYEALVELAAP